MSRLIVVQGPTAAGKTSTAVNLALHYGCDILSADSRQFYREMTIGSAVPTAGERALARHHFIQDRSLLAPLSSGEYEKEALMLLENIFQSNHTAILVGGSGLYVDALLYGLDPLPSSEEIRAQLNEIYASQGLEPILYALKVADPVHYNMVDRSNPMRVLRALEVCRASGMPYSTLRSGRRTVRDFEVCRLVVDMPRAELYDRINRRVDMMIDEGLQDEARGLIPHRDLSPLKTVGYSEFFEYFDGNLSLTQCIDKIKQHTRNYAKRQLTWLARDRDLPRFEPHETKTMIEYIDGNN